MSRFSNLLRGAIGLGAIVGIAACGDVDSKVNLPTSPAATGILRSYVALGNSITAGVQSGGLNDSTQRTSYANLFALQAGTRFSYPSFISKLTVPVGTGTVTFNVGCPAATGNWFSGKATDSLLTTPVPCALRDPAKVTDILNNVAVPFAYATDLTLTGPGVIFPTPQHTFILGGMSQVDRALVAKPTFVSVWVGNNETLAPASVGLLGGLSTNVPPVPPVVSSTVFIAALKKSLDSLVKVRPDLEGILISAVRVTNTPRFFSADTLQLSATRKTQFETFHGRGVTTIIGCGTLVTGWLVSSELIKAIKAGSHPNVVSCIANTPAPPLGDIFMLSPQEVQALNDTTDKYNVYIKAKADTLGWAYLDLNPILAAQKTGTPPAIPAHPNFTSTTRDAATAVFGALFSLDGVHPSAAGQKLIANAMIDAVNAKYSFTIPRVP